MTGNFAHLIFCLQAVAVIFLFFFESFVILPLCSGESLLGAGGALASMPEAISPAEVCNREGNRALREQNYLAAVDSYSQGLLDECGGELRAVLLSNRSSAFAHLERWQEALNDAESCLGVRPEWSRSHACHGAALEGIGRNTEALGAFRRALDLDSENLELKSIVTELQQMEAAGSGSFDPAFASSAADLSSHDIQVPAEAANPNTSVDHRNGVGKVATPGKPNEKEYMGPVFSDRVALSDRRGGVGMALAYNHSEVMKGEGDIVVDGLAPWSPLRDTGVSIGDRLAAIDGTDVDAIPFHVVQTLIRGTPGTPVSLVFFAARASGDDAQYTVQCVCVRARVSASLQ